jgi:Cu+-exporting ATPase
MTRENAGTESSSSSTMATDPVCGMRVERALAVGTEEFSGRLYFFCSASCKQTFHANAAHYARAGQDRADAAEPDPRR